MEGVVALLIPIVGSVGLFTAIAFGLFFKYKTKKALAERVPADSLAEWFNAESKAKALSNRGAALRWGGFLTGLGLGVLIGCLSTISAGDIGDAYITFIIIACALLFGGGGLVGAYFLERKFDKTNKD